MLSVAKTFKWAAAVTFAASSMTVGMTVQAQYYPQNFSSGQSVQYVTSTPQVASSGNSVVTQPVSFHGHHHGGAGQYFDSGMSSGGFGNTCPGCGQMPGHCNGRGGHRCWLFQEMHGKKSPDYGYSPPAKYPLHRRGVEYTSYYPNQWYGLPGGGLAGGAPMVYQPTDTTQLGYYYQHVPFWQPNPGMMPQRPVPAQWHITAPPYQSQGCGSGCGSHRGFSDYYGRHRCGFGRCGSGGCGIDGCGSADCYNGWSSRHGRSFGRRSCRSGFCDAGMCCDGNAMMDGVHYDYSCTSTAVPPVQGSPESVVPAPIEHGTPVPSRAVPGNGPNPLPTAPEAAPPAAPRPTQNSAASEHIRRARYARYSQY